MKQEFSVPKLAAQLRSETGAHLLLERLRYVGEDRPEACLKCGARSTVRLMLDLVALGCGTS